MGGYETVETIGWALFGGFIAEFIGIFELQHRVLADLPYWFRSKFYWASVLGMIIVGGVWRWPTGVLACT